MSLIRLPFFYFLIIIIVIYLSLANLSPVKAIKLNEVYLNPPDGENEWVEVFNEDIISIDLSQFTVMDEKNQPLQFIDAQIAPLSFAVAQSAKNILNQDKDTVKLLNSQNEVIDTVTYASAFSATNSYARCPDGTGDWVTVSLVTKNQTNLAGCQTITPKPTPSLTETITLQPTINPSAFPSETIMLTPDTGIFSRKIYLSEAMVNPATGDSEWLEIYNDNPFSVNLNSWYYDDLENAGASPKLFSLLIPAQSYATIDLSSSMFNNDADSVRLLDANFILIDSFEYSKTEKDKSWGRISFNSDQFCLQSPSKNLPNTGCLYSIANTVSPTKIISPTLTITPVTVISLNPTSPPLYPTEVFNIIPNTAISGDILGQKTKTTIASSPQLLANDSFSLISLIYSLLTIFSLSLKMKINVIN